MSYWNTMPFLRYCSFRRGTFLAAYIRCTYINGVHQNSHCQINVEYAKTNYYWRSTGTSWIINQFIRWSKPCIVLIRQWLFYNCVFFNYTITHIYSAEHTFRPLVLHFPVLVFWSSIFSSCIFTPDIWSCIFSPAFFVLSSFLVLHFLVLHFQSTRLHLLIC